MATSPVVTVRTWGPDAYEERVGVESLRERDPARPIWVDVSGLSDRAAIAEIGTAFGLHSLSLEDVLDASKRPKAEQYETYTFVVLQALSLEEGVRTRVLGLCFGDGFVVTFREPEMDWLEPVPHRLRHARGRLRVGVDYLAYAIVDTFVDRYFPVLEELDDRLAALEDEVLEARTTDPIGLTRHARRDVRAIRHVIRATGDALSALLHDDARDVSDDVRMYLRSCQDHVRALQELVEASREAASALLETYLSAVTMRTNEVMKVLTVIATIFIPLTFITGIYGMNFDPATSPMNMPETEWYWGYPFALGLMVATAALFVIYMWRRGFVQSAGTRSRQRAATGAGVPESLGGSPAGRQRQPPSVAAGRSARAIGPSACDFSNSSSSTECRASAISVAPFIASPLLRPSSAVVTSTSISSLQSGSSRER